MLRGRLRTWLFRLTALACSTAAALALAEGTLRAVLTVTEVPEAVPDPLVGVRWAPGQTGTWIGPGFAGDFRINAQGYNAVRDFPSRDTEHTLVDAPGRVVLLGDSFAEALQTGPERALAARLEARLPTPIEVLPYAHSGFGLAQQYLTLRDEAIPVRPRAVIILFVHNDVNDSYAPLSANAHLPTFDLDATGALVPVPARRPLQRSLVADVLRHSALVRYAWVQRRLANRWLAWREREAIARQPRDLEPDPSAWAVYEALLDAAVAIVDEAIGPGRLLVDEVPPDPHVPRDESPLGAMLARACEARGVPCLDLRPAFRDALDEDASAPLFIPGDGHWTPRGHEVAAKALAPWPPLRSALGLAPSETRLGGS